MTPKPEYGPAEISTLQIAYRVLVCGGRDFADRSLVFETLDDVMARSQWPLHVIQGGAEGADALAREWAQARCVPMTTYPANWRAHGKGAGPIRNQQMIDDGRPWVIVAFPGGRGTADMVRRAIAAKLPVKTVERSAAKSALPALSALDSLTTETEKSK